MAALGGPPYYGIKFNSVGLLSNVDSIDHKTGDTQTTQLVQVVWFACWLYIVHNYSLLSM